jgi:hypothetical protein
MRAILSYLVEWSPRQLVATLVPDGVFVALPARFLSSWIIPYIGLFKELIFRMSVSQIIYVDARPGFKYMALSSDCLIFEHLQPPNRRTVGLPALSTHQHPAISTPKYPHARQMGH